MSHRLLRYASGSRPGARAGHNPEMLEAYTILGNPVAVVATMQRFSQQRGS